MKPDETFAEEANEKRLEWCDLLNLAVSTKDWGAVKELLGEMKRHEFS